MARRKGSGSAARRLFAVAVLLAAVALLLQLPSAPAIAGRATALTGAGLGVPPVPRFIDVLMPDGSVREMEMDEYLKGVVPSEVNPSWRLDALEAQAIAARCYASNRHHSNANVCTTTHCQAWSTARDPRTDLAVVSTHGSAALYENEVINAFYFGHCNGKTRNSEDVWSGTVPYCRGVPCPCGNSKMFGHGVGMCQEGAAVLAAAGWDYADILEHYYTGATVADPGHATTDWYFAEGTTRNNFVTYFCISNPSDDYADVSLDYLMDDGKTKQGVVAVPPRARFTINAADDIGPGRDFSCRLRSANDVPIVAERPMYFNYNGVWSGGHNTMGTDAPAGDWYFAEGTTRTNFVTYFCIANPSDDPASVSLSYYMDDGSSKDALHFVAPHSRKTVDASADVGPEKDFSCRVRSTNGVDIIAERPMYFNYSGLWTGGHDAVGARSPKNDWFFAEGTTRNGFATYFCIANPTDDDAQLTLTYMIAGENPVQKRCSIPARSRKTIAAVDDVGYGRDFSCRVYSGNKVPVVAERPMYFEYGGVWTGGHNAIGTPYPRTEWHFAEGTARPNFVTYLCVQNTSDKTADVRIVYYRADGTTEEQSVQVPAGSRETVSANDLLGQANDYAHDFALRVTSVNRAAIVVERPMYFNYGGRWSGGHNTMGW